MSDYLSRAVERAEPGAVSSIRPRIASRYERAPEALPETASSERETVPGALSPARESTPHPEASESPRRQEIPPFAPPARSEVQPRAEVRPAAPAVRADVFPAPVASPAKPALERALPPQAPPPVKPPAPLLVERVIVREIAPAASSQPAKSAPTPAPAKESLATVRPAPTAPGRPVEKLTISVREESGSITPVAPKGADAPRPAPLLEMARAVLPPAAVPMPAAPSTPPTVNITIGRLEIRAATPSAGPARTQPRAKEGGPLALDEFLRNKSPRPRSRS